MDSWKCPHCGRVMHSSAKEPKQHAVRCIYCDEYYPNPFFRVNDEE